MADIASARALGLTEVVEHTPDHSAVEYGLVRLTHCPIVVTCGPKGASLGEGLTAFNLTRVPAPR